ncbi:MAG: aldo/keto reductase [Micromonosporaceae bacterium]
MTGTVARTVTLPGGVEMPLVGLGTWQLTGRQAYEAIRHALAVGYRHIDTATMYRNEDQVGRALRDSGLRREDVFLTTKLLPEQAGREREALDASLTALDTDHVDLWLIHWPPARRVEATWQKFLAVRDEGLARSVGVSNFDLAEIDQLIRTTGEAPAVNQIRWAPALHDPQVLAGHRERGVVLEGYSPFKSTDLDDPVLREIADAHGVTPAQVVLRWHIEHGIVVIPKSGTPERIERNFDVFGFSLRPQEMARIDALGTG